MRKSDAHTPLCTQTQPCVLSGRHSPMFGTVITPCVPSFPQRGLRSGGGGGKGKEGCSEGISDVLVPSPDVRGKRPGVESDSGGRDLSRDLAVYLQRLP